MGNSVRRAFDGEKRKLPISLTADDACLLFRRSGGHDRSPLNLSISIINPMRFQCVSHPKKHTPNSLPQLHSHLRMWTPTHNPNPFSSPNSTFAAEAPSAGLHKNMEDVWKDISLSSDLNHHHHHPSSRGMILLDFFSSDPPPEASSAVSPPPPQPAMLTLSSARDLQPNDGSSGSLQNMHFDDDLAVPDADHHHNAAGVAGKKRLPEPERNSGDRRHKRMIKNRESAARSRARKQAYTNELELEVAHLLEENARLKKQQQQWHEAAEFHQHSKKKSLCRTWTAPF